MTVKSVRGLRGLGWQWMSKSVGAGCVSLCCVPGTYFSVIDWQQSTPSLQQTSTSRCSLSADWLWRSLHHYMLISSEPNVKPSTSLCSTCHILATDNLVHSSVSTKAVQHMSEGFYVLPLSFWHSIISQTAERRPVNNMTFGSTPNSHVKLTQTFRPPLPNFVQGSKIRNLARIFDSSRFQAPSFRNETE